MSRALLGWALLTTLAAGCASGSAGPDAEAVDTAPRATLRCALSVGGVHMARDDEAELLKGYQGYLLVMASAHFWGDVPRSLQIRLSGAREGHDPLVSVVGRRTPEPDADGHLSTEPLEIWLSPPNPEAFAGRAGTLTLEARDGARSCTAEIAVRFVDRTFCVHYDDGSVVCPESAP